jgi:hypothetical protein
VRRAVGWPLRVIPGERLLREVRRRSFWLEAKARPVAAERLRFFRGSCEFAGASSARGRSTGWVL